MITYVNQIYRMLFAPTIQNEISDRITLSIRRPVLRNTLPGVELITGLYR